VFWSAELLAKVNEENESRRHAPAFFVIGGDADDPLFGIDLRPGAPAARYVVTDSIAIGWDYILWRGDSFRELIRHISSIAIWCDSAEQ
jgi:hypothetical protein